MIEPMDKYHSSLISNPGLREIYIAGRANKSSRVIELDSGGNVLPIRWKMLDVTKTIPAEMKFKETIRRYSLPKAMTGGWRETVRIMVPGNWDAMKESN